MRNPRRLNIPRLNAIAGSLFGFLIILVILVGLGLIALDTNPYNKTIGLAMVVFMVLSGKFKDIKKTSLLWGCIKIGDSD